MKCNFFLKKYKKLIFQVRCLSHNDFSLPLKKAAKVLHAGSCSRRTMLSCECSTCKSPPASFQSNHLVSQKSIDIAQASESMEVAELNGMPNNLDYEPSKQSSDATANKKELVESVNNQQQTRKPEITTANISHCSYCRLTYIASMILSNLILLHLFH